VAVMNAYWLRLLNHAMQKDYFNQPDKRHKPACDQTPGDRSRFSRKQSGTSVSKRGAMSAIPPRAYLFMQLAEPSHGGWRIHDRIQDINAAMRDRSKRPLARSSTMLWTSGVSCAPGAQQR
jgi:hypothetical protein